MVLNQKPTGRTSSMPAGLALGGLISLLVTVLGSAGIAALVNGETIQETQIGYGIMIVVMMASFLGAFTAATKIRRRRLLVCGLSATVYFGILMAVTAVFFGGQYEAVGVTLLLVFGGAALPIFTGGPIRRGGKRRKAIVNLYKNKGR